MNEDGTGLPPKDELKNDTGQAEIESLRKEAEQAKMRANQLANELAERNKTDEEAKQAKLKENEEYKTLFEQEQTKRKELEEKTSRDTAQAAAKAAETELAKGYSKEVIELADAAGINLADASDEAQASFKSKLDAIAQKVTPGRSPVTGNNQRPNVPTAPERANVLTGMRAGSKVATSEYVRGLPAVEAMRRMAGVQTPQG